MERGGRARRDVNGTAGWMHRNSVRLRQLHEDDSLVA
jgi:hypothetical protein